MEQKPDFIPSPNPNGIQIYDIVSIERVEEVDGFWWIEARAACGHSISVASPQGSGTPKYGVLISTGDTPSTYRTVRHYSGDEGSDAERVFKSFLDALAKFEDTSRTR